MIFIEIIFSKKASSKNNVCILFKMIKIANGHGQHSLYKYHVVQNNLTQNSYKSLDNEIKIPIQQNNFLAIKFLQVNHM